ncbi:MAG: tail fiber domain-containing protein [Candidatus Omnitrophota bacterium]
MRKNKLLLLVLAFILITPLLIFAEEITLTTYYPSPYGSYNALQVDKLGVGDNDNNGSLTSADVPTTTGDAWIRGKVGIGTNGPAYKLEVKGNMVNTIPSQGYLGLTGDLPGYAVDTYPTLKTNGTYIFFSAGGVYSAYMSSGGVWTAASSRDMKENFVELNPLEILAKIEKLPVMEWNYKSENANIKHIGPFAEDFYALFKLNGSDNKHLAHIDPPGVALVGIKALSVKINKQQQEIEKLQREIEELRLQIKAGL